MSAEINARLETLGITLPQAASPAANYLPWKRSGSTLYISGQLPLEDGKLTVTGLLGSQVKLEEAQKAARLCAINILAQASAALSGDLSRIKQVVKITSFVASAPDFTDHHLVTNGASDLLVDVLGDAGKHARAAVGMAALPLKASVEIEAILEVE